MQDSGTAPTTILQFRQDIQARLRERVREAIEATLDAELAAALGSARHERTVVRSGYRPGAITRTVTTVERHTHIGGAAGADRDGAQGVSSEMLPRYARRTREVDDALLACYLAGANSRRIHTALKPLLGERHLSKSAVSSVVARLKALFTT